MVSNIDTTWGRRVHILPVLREYGQKIIYYFITIFSRNIIMPILDRLVHRRYFKWFQYWAPNITNIGVHLPSMLQMRHKITQEQERTQIWECIFFNVFVYCTGINVQNLILGFKWQPQEKRTLCKFGMNTWSTVQSHFLRDRANSSWSHEIPVRQVQFTLSSKLELIQKRNNENTVLSCHIFSQIRISGKILVLTKPHGQCSDGGWAPLMSCKTS